MFAFKYSAAIKVLCSGSNLLALLKSNPYFLPYCWITPVYFCPLSFTPPLQVPSRNWYSPVALLVGALAFGLKLDSLAAITCINVASIPALWLAEFIIDFTSPPLWEFLAIVASSAILTSVLNEPLELPESPLL